MRSYDEPPTWGAARDKTNDPDRWDRPLSGHSEARGWNATSSIPTLARFEEP